MPNIYKASSVTLTGDAVPIDIGETLETPQMGSKGPSALPAKNDRLKPSETLEEARGEADMIILKARNEAQLIMDKAGMEINRQRAESEENARSKGYSEGFYKGSAEAEALKRKAEEALRNAIAERDRMLKDMEPQVVGLIIKIMEKLIGGAVQLNPRVIIYLIRKGLSEAVGTEGIKVRVSPDEFKVVKGHFDEIVESAGSKDVELIKDASLNSMDCLIETAYGNIDSSLDQQFESLKTDLFLMLNNSEA